MTASIPQSVQDCHDLLLWLIPQLDKFPRVRRFTLGERLESGLLQVLELLVEAAYSRDKNAALSHANRRLETIRHLWRLAHELQVSVFASPSPPMRVSGPNPEPGRLRTARVWCVGVHESVSRLRKDGNAA